MAAKSTTTKLREPHPADDLSFMRRRSRNEGGGIDYWVVESTGGLETDWNRGEDLGDEYLDYVGRHPTNGNSTLLASIVESMFARRSRLTGLELGFLRTVNRYAMGLARVRVEQDGDAS